MYTKLQNRFQIVQFITFLDHPIRNKLAPAITKKDSKTSTSSSGATRQ